MTHTASGAKAELAAVAVAKAALWGYRQMALRDLLFLLYLEIIWHCY